MAVIDLSLKNKISASLPFATSISFVRAATSYAKTTITGPLTFTKK